MGISGIVAGRDQRRCGVREDLLHADARRRFSQHEPVVRRLDHRQLGDDQTDAADGGRRKGKLFDDLRLALGGCAASRRRRVSRRRRDPSRRPCPEPFCREPSSWRDDPCASTCRPPSTVMSRWPPRISAKLVALSKLIAPGSAEMKPPPASVRCGSSMPSGGGAPKPMMPFSL